MTLNRRHIIELAYAMAQRRNVLIVDCGDDIPFARLQAQPAAERWLVCQQRHEKTYRT